MFASCPCFGACGVLCDANDLGRSPARLGGEPGVVTKNSRVPTPRSPLRDPGGAFEQRLSGKVSSGQKFLAVYVTAGLPDVKHFEPLVERVAAAGADIVEIGIPFSDPIMDGPVIQRASKRALESGVTPPWALESASRIASLCGSDVDLVVMTYSNLAFRMGFTSFSRELAAAGVGGVILADLPLEESELWENAAMEAGVAPVLLAAPNCSDERLARVASRSRGFVYGISLLGVTGARKTVSEMAKEIGERLKRVSDVPVGVGIGISSGSHAAEVAAHCDGVIVGSALVQRILDAEDPVAAIEAAESFVAELRGALS
ncbi:MAG: tryptophan synthase subunit alpha [Acidimicrobiia bacterium]